MSEVRRPIGFGPRERAVDEARTAIGAGLVVGSVFVQYYEPAYDTGQVWVKANCNTCDAERVMRASHSTHLTYLAMTMVNNACLERGHDQREDVAMFDGIPRHFGSMDAQELNELRTDAEERLVQAQHDLGVVAVYQARLTGGEA